MAYAHLEDWAKAAADGRTCIAKAPRFIKGYHRAALALQHLEEYKEAIRLLEMGLTHFPGNADLKQLLDQVRPRYEQQVR